jgi:hypothetical protein
MSLPHVAQTRRRPRFRPGADRRGAVQTPIEVALAQLAQSACQPVPVLPGLRPAGEHMISECR